MPARAASDARVARVVGTGAVRELGEPTAPEFTTAESSTLISEGRRRVYPRLSRPWRTRRARSMSSIPSYSTILRLWAVLRTGCLPSGPRALQAGAATWQGRRLGKVTRTLYSLQGDAHAREPCTGTQAHSLSRLSCDRHETFRPLLRRPRGGCALPPKSGSSPASPRSRWARRAPRRAARAPRASRRRARVTGRRRAAPFLCRGAGTGAARCRGRLAAP